MASMKQDNYFSSSNYYGEDVASSPAAAHNNMEPVDILASCYLVSNYPGAQMQLKGLHYCATGVTGAEWYS